MSKKSLLGIILAVLCLGATSYAQESANQDSDSATGTEQHHHHAPSQAAIDACSGKSADDSCDYTNSKGDDKSGTCANSSDQQLFCKGSRHSS